MEKVTSNYYEIDVKDSLAVVFFKNDVFELLCNRDNSGLLIKTLDNLKYDLKIKALLFLNEPECYGEKVYDRFLGKIMLPKSKSSDFEMPNFYDTKSRYREINILNHFVEYIANYNKLCFTVLSGGIVTPFFGLSLATDIRYATPETYFSLAHNKYGLHPTGALPYFLTHQIGYNKAIELMFSEKISSKEALELGLINKIIPNENYLDSVFNDIKRITKFPNSTLRTTKQLFSFTRNSLSDYLKFDEA